MTLDPIAQAAADKCAAEIIRVFFRDGRPVVANDRRKGPR